MVDKHMKRFSRSLIIRKIKSNYKIPPHSHWDGNYQKKKEKKKEERKRGEEEEEKEKKKETK